MFLFSVCFVRDSFIQHIVIVERLTYFNACKLLIYSREQENIIINRDLFPRVTYPIACFFYLDVCYSCIDLHFYNKNLICKILNFFFTFFKNLIDVYVIESY